MRHTQTRPWTSTSRTSNSTFVFAGKSPACGILNQHFLGAMRHAQTRRLTSTRWTSIVTGEKATIVYPIKPKHVSHAAGANKAIDIYQPDITSYDYDCPVSEAGGYGQPGIGGPSKFEVRCSARTLPAHRNPYYANDTLAARLCQHSALAAEVLRSPACVCFALTRRATAQHWRVQQVWGEPLCSRPASGNIFCAYDNVAACLIRGAYLQ